MEAIIFDYGGVLCFHPDDQKISGLAALCGLDHDRFLEVYWRERVAYDRGDFTPEEYWQHRLPSEVTKARRSSIQTR